jgi:hypothetical protein
MRHGAITFEKIERPHVCECSACMERGANIARLREALSELADLMDDVVGGNYKPDSFTTQPARLLLK